MSNPVNMTASPGQLINDMVMLGGRAQGSFAATTAGADVDDLPAGRYAVWCDEGDVYVKVHATDASNVTVASAGGNGGFVVRHGNVVLLWVPNNFHLGAVMASGSGTLRYHIC